MNRKRIALCIALVALLVFPVAADNQVISSSRVLSLSDEGNAAQNADWQSYTGQLGLTEQIQIDLDYLQEVRLMQAAGEAGYPTTVGDVYTLAYLYNGQSVTFRIQLDHSGIISIPNIGSFTVEGKTFSELKSEVESAVSARFPYSNPTLVMTQTGSFQIYVSGLVDSSRQVDCWGLSRLSDLAWYASSNASTRDVTVISADGNEKHYDLYAALREGKAEENPLLRPGDRVVFNRRENAVLVNGSVMRSGTYQIEGSTDLCDVIETYALGLDRQADANRISVSRYVDGAYTSYTVSYTDDFTLQDGDSVYVYSAELPIGSVTLDGALSTTGSGSSANTIAGQVSAQYFYRFLEGETVEDMLVDMSQYFTAGSDLDGCYLTRDGKSTPISIRNILYGNDPDGDIVLQNGDRFTIPFSNQIVTVNGAVNNPGTFGYVPGKDASYYINLAGGLSSSAKGADRYRLYNSYGERVDSSTPITAETTIEVERSNFERDLGIAVSVIGVVGTIATITSTIIGIVNALN